MKRSLIFGCAALLLPLSPLAAEEAKQEPRALGVESSITFPGSSSIRNWDTDRNRGIWIQDRKGDWFYGTFAGFCSKADFAHIIAFETPGVSKLDRFSTIIVDGERCALSSFVTSAPPPTRKEKEAARKAEKAKKAAEKQAEPQ